MTIMKRCLSCVCIIAVESTSFIAILAEVRTLETQRPPRFRIINIACPELNGDYVGKKEDDDRGFTIVPVEYVG